MKRVREKAGATFHWTPLHQLTRQRRGVMKESAIRHAIELRVKGESSMKDLKGVPELELWTDW